MTGEFEAGDRQTIELPRATRENSASLEVIATDEDDQALSGATVTVLLDGLLALPPAQTALRRAPAPSPGEEFEAAPLEPSAFFPVLPLGLSYELRGKYQKGVGRGFEALTDDLLARLPLLVNTGFLDVYATDFVTGKNIAGARFELKSDSAVLSSCDGSPCTLVARAYSTGSIHATAGGYLPTTRPLNQKDVVAGATKTINVVLLPAGAVNATMIRFTGLTDENGDAVYDLVRANYSYYANFIIASNNAARTGLHARVGSAADVKSDKAGIIDFSPPANYEMAKSTSYHSGASCENDLRNSNPEGELFKWVDLSFEGAGTANIAVPIQVKDTAKNGDQLAIHYRGYSFIETRGGTKIYSRVPADRSLGTNESTANKASCYAETNSTSYEIIVPIAEEKPPEEEIPLPKAEFTVSDTIVLDEQGNLKSAHGLEEYALQIDPVYPADAMPLKLKSKIGGCIVLVSQLTGNASTSKCFRYDPTTNNLVFESKETNPLCPVEVKANKLYEGTREFKSQQGASINYRVAGCDITAELTIPITVTAQEAESIYAAPDGNELGDGDAAKPLYVVNQKQLGSRDITVDYAPTEATETNRTLAEKQSQISLYGGSAHALAFRGPGTLTLSDGEETINEVYYQDTLRVMKEGIGTTGYRKTSCDNYKCCTHGWCTRKALKSALKDFTETASQTAAKTAFRRGGGQPFATLSPDKTFTFATVAQTIQGADSLLTENNYTIEQSDYETGACTNGTPAVFELKASGTNADNLTYSAQVLP
ncbi:MAG: hypothetical protein AB1626_05825, partial [Candidatus Micrarchaeota archaeon]